MIKHLTNHRATNNKLEKNEWFLINVRFIFHHMTKKPLTILYGTETGNSEDLANQVFETAQEKGIEAKLVGAMDYYHC